MRSRLKSTQVSRWKSAARRSQNPMKPAKSRCSLNSMANPVSFVLPTGQSPAKPQRHPKPIQPIPTTLVITAATTLAMTVVTTLVTTLATTIVTAFSSNEQQQLKGNTRARFDTLHAICEASTHPRHNCQTCHTSEPFTVTNLHFFSVSQKHQKENSSLFSVSTHCHFVETHLAQPRHPSVH